MGDAGIGPEQLLALQAKVLECIAYRRDIELVLKRLCLLVEGMLPGSVCSIMKYDESTGHLNIESAPCAPKGLIERLGGLVPAALAGSCGTAAYTGRMAIVTDTLEDPRWAVMDDVVEAYGIRACWSIPVKSKDERVLGTFAISWPNPCAPTEAQTRLLETAGHLCGVALEQERIELEMVKTQRAMQQTQKLGSLGVLSGGIAHDFNNLLAGILGNADWCLSEGQLEPEFNESLQDIKTAAMHASELVDQMMAYAGESTFTKQPLDLRSTVMEMSKLVESSISKKARLVYDFPEQLPAIHADASQIRQVVMNVLINASDALKDGNGTIAISAASISGTPDLPGLNAMGFAPRRGHYVCLTVRDTGCGMDEQTALRIFDPFFTNKPSGRGLGLAAVLGIIRSHLGTITVDSQPGEGTTLHILLPASGAHAPPRAQTPEFAKPDLPAVTILMVDDEPLLLRLGLRILDNTPLTVVTARNGHEALSLFERLGDRLSLVLIDATMPEMSGHEVIEAIRRINPTIPIIMASGQDRQRATTSLQPDDLAGFVHKPYKARELLDTLKRALSPPPTELATV